MPTENQIARGREIGRRGDYQKYIWSACLDCGKSRWVVLAKGEPSRLRCQSCANAVLGFLYTGANAKNWNGGRLEKEGYVYVRIPSDDFFYSMANNGGYMLEHRLVIARQVNRHLLPWEVVHHINGVKNDNRIENLELLPHRKYHLVDNKTKAYIVRLKKQVAKLKGELELYRRSSVYQKKPESR